jgi:signal peptidase I
MVSIQLGTAPAAPHGAFRDAVDWGRVVVATLARGVIATLLGMALWAAAPAVIGWHPTTVMTGSMEPRLHPGDVVVSRPVAEYDIRVGQVLLFDDPDQPGELRMHRFVKVASNGQLVTKGDANPQRDSSTISRSAVHGVAFIRVPYVGMPIMWLRDGEWKNVILLVLALTGIAALATIDGSLRRGSATDESSGGAPGDPDEPAPVAVRHGSGARHAVSHRVAVIDLEVRGASDPRATVASSVASGDGDGAGAGSLAAAAGAGSLAAAAGSGSLAAAASRGRLRRARVRRRRVRRAWGLGTVVVAAGVAVLLPTAASAVAFSKTTGNPTSSYTATSAVTQATAVTCTPNGSGVTISWTYTDTNPTNPTQFELMTGTNSLVTVTGTARSASLTAANAGLIAIGTYPITIRTDLGSSSPGYWQATSTSSVNVKVSSLIGLGSVACA